MSPAKTRPVSKDFPLSKSLGVLGAGQLSRMIGQSAQTRGLAFRVFAESPSDCALAITPFATMGSLRDFKKVSEFAKSCDWVTFESEFFPAAEFLEYLKQQQQSNLTTKFFPKLEHLALFQKRTLQKKWLLDHEIPTAQVLNLAESSSSKDKLALLQKSLKTHSQGFVLKRNFGGYDGYGTFFYPEVSRNRTPSQLDDLLAEELMIEEKVRFKKELAVSIACSESEMTFLPLVETFQKEGRCDWVKGPTVHKAWPGLQKKLKKALKSLNYSGLITFELFDTGAELLVNEIAPRVHNSGHYSLDALEISQFEYHWRSGMDLTLPSPKLLSKFFVMTNLVGESENAPRIPEGLSGALHWYGKTPNRPRRKMGHINYRGSAPKILDQALKERKRIEL